MQKMIFRISFLSLLLFSAVLTATSRDVSEGDNNDHWVGTWSTSLHPPDLGVPGLANAGFNNQTLRQIVHTSLGGRRVRVRFSTFGANSVLVGAAHIALHTSGAAIVPGSDRALTFGGSPSITIPAGALVVSDPVDLDVRITPQFASNTRGQLTEFHRGFIPSA